MSSAGSTLTISRGLSQRPPARCGQTPAHPPRHRALLTHKQVVLSILGRRVRFLPVIAEDALDHVTHVTVPVHGYLTDAKIVPVDDGLAAAVHVALTPEPRGRGQALCP